MSQVFRSLLLVALNLLMLLRPTACLITPNPASVIQWNCNGAASKIYVSHPDWTDPTRCQTTAAYSYPTTQDTQETCLQDYLTHLNATRGQMGIRIDVAGTSCFPPGESCSTLVVCKQSPPAVSGECPPYKATTGSVVTYPTGRTVYSQVLISCMPGFEYVDLVPTTPKDTAVSCEKMLTWGGAGRMAAQCAAITCPDLVNPSNGKVSSGNNTYSASRQYSCDLGFVLSGNSTTGCLANGVWSAPMPLCNEQDRTSTSTSLTQSTSKATADAIADVTTSASMYQFLGIGIAVGLLVPMVGAACYLAYRRKKKSTTSKPQSPDRRPNPSQDITLQLNSAYGLAGDPTYAVVNEPETAYEEIPT